MSVKLLPPLPGKGKPPVPPKGKPPVAPKGKLPLPPKGKGAGVPPKQLPLPIPHS